ncbi:hypothetical protein F7Q99_31535 [Streptomyces kaniharaensis]|uniref:Uncharacterized protein n=1 Tax=Streptomyces kaniharaensis TaxID=212423 RepID=A0A6N7KYH9_9ACTN|nr:hypothetical protein [Streptomyces kaniharaensis]MQS16600.1 hypothetical protein [Streptomyces kaniharaensis]
MTAGTGSDLVATVVEALVQSASNAVGAAGAALGGEAVARVREALRQWPQWAHALGRVEAFPGDPQAQWDLALAVGQLLGRDPGLAANLRARLSVAMTAPPPAATEPVPQMSHPGDGANWPAFGAGTVLGTPSRRGRIWALTGVVVVLAVVGSAVGLGIYLNSGPDGPKPLATLDQVKSVLPDLHAVPDGWTQEKAPSAGPMGGCSDAATSPAQADLCNQVLGTGSSRFHADNGKTQVVFNIMAGPSPAWADKMYDSAYSVYSDLPDKLPMAAPKAGERSAIYRDSECLDFLVKTGSTVLRISYCPENPDAPNAELVNRITRMFATRSQQAQDGKTPDAAA